ncbi:hypothetical protein RvY_16973-2 [Ramazzottius varieornatus]|uniref:Nucleoprotein TPR n=1 Tax=Ramazzottius varieornatus TaxID=947166 RepID=A0A1D1W0H8_RAMVA|nr:hypothetical protein RvY_16973-2 [Ramazzottius varieornatus]
MASGSADEVPSSSQGFSGSPSMEDQLLQEREVLRSEIQRMQTDHKRAVDLVRSTLERQLQEANIAINGLREELAKEVNINQDHLKRHESQAKKESDLKKALVSAEDHNLRLSTEKNNLLLLVEGSRAEIAELRETIRNQSRQVTESLAETELLRLKCCGKDAEIQFLGISEKSLKAQTERQQKDLSEAHAVMVKKDREISEARSEADRRVKDVIKQVQTLSDELWQEKRKVAMLEDNVKREKEGAQRLQERLDSFEGDRQRMQEEFSEQNSSQQEIIDSFREHVAVLKRRNDQLEEEKRVQESCRDDLEEVYKRAVSDLQEELSSAQTALEEKTNQVAAMTAELEHARDLTAYLKNDASRTASPELQNLVRGQGFSVPRLYHEYIITADRLSEAVNARAAAESELERRSQEWQQYLAGRSEEEAAVQELQRQLERSQNNLQQLTKKVENMEKQAVIHRRNLRTLETENRTLRDKNEVLQRQVISVVEDNDEENGGFLLSKSTYRNTAELIQINAELYASIESLNKENYDLKVQLEEATKNEEEFREAVEQVRGLAAQKEQFDTRLTELSREVQLYRVQNESSLFKDFLRILSTAPEQMDALLALVSNESALWAFVRSAGGNDIATQFAAIHKEVQVARQEAQEARVEAEKRSTELQKVREAHKADMKIINADRDRAVRDLNVLRDQMDALRRESSQRIAEADRQVAKMSELYERLCNSEKECGTLAQALENQREESGRRLAECQELRSTASSVHSRLAVFEEQQTRAQTVISQHMATIEAAHAREIESGRKLQEAQDSLSNQQNKAAHLQRELQTQQSKVELLTKELTDVKKQLDEYKTRTNNTQQQQNTNAASSSQERSNNSQASSQYALSVLRQSSVQQETLQMQIGELQGQLEKAREELKEKVAELNRYQEKATKKSEEMQGTRYSLMSDIAHIKEERETLKTQLNAAKADKLKAEAERKKLEEVSRRQRSELEEQMNKYMDELQAHQVSQAFVAELRKEVDQLKQSAMASKRRETDLQKAMDELRKQTAEQEKKLREEVRLMEIERENNKEWKRTIYDRTLPSSTDVPSDEVQDLTIIVEYQKKENDSIFRQLQLSKEDCFAGAAKVKFLSEGLEQVQQELQLVIQRKEGSIESDSWQKSYTEQQAILNSTLQMNAKLRMEVATVQKELETTRASLKTLTDKSEAATSRLRELENDNVRLQEAEKVLKQQVQDWHNKFGVQQQKGEIETLKRRIAELEKQNADQNDNVNKLKAQFASTVSRRVQARSKEMEQALEDARGSLEERSNELTTLRVQLAAREAEIITIKAEHAEFIRTEGIRHFKELRQNEEQANAALAALRIHHDQYKEAAHQLEMRLNALMGGSAVPGAKIAEKIPVPVPIRETAVVTPQSKGLADKMTPVPTLTLRASGHAAPIATVAPQVPHDLLAHVQPVQASAQMQRPSSGHGSEAARPASHDEGERVEAFASAGGSGSGNAGGTGHATPATPPSGGTLVGSVRREVRRPHPDSDEQPGGSQPQRQPKRPRPASSAAAAAPTVSVVPSGSRMPSLRPPSPTSVTDVTSSTAPAASTHTATPAQSDRSEDRAVGSSGEAGPSAAPSHHHPQVEEADGVTESSMGPSPGTVTNPEAQGEEAPDQAEGEAMVVDEGGPSTSQPIMEEPGDEAQPAISDETAGSHDHATAAASAPLPDDGGSHEEDRPSVADVAMDSNEAATSSASLPDQPTAMDVVLQPPHGHSRSLDDAMAITDMLSMADSRHDLDTDILEGILEGQGTGDAAEEGEVESEEEEEQGEGTGQEDGGGEEELGSRDTDESAPSESEVRLNLGPTVLSAGDGTALTGVPSTSQSSLDSSEGGAATPSASQTQLAASQSIETQPRLRRQPIRATAPSSSSEAQMSRVSPAAPSASSSGNLGNNSPQRTSGSTRRPISPPNASNMHSPNPPPGRPSRALPTARGVYRPGQGLVSRGTRGGRPRRGPPHQ